MECTLCHPRVNLLFLFWQKHFFDIFMICLNNFGEWIQNMLCNFGNFVWFSNCSVEPYAEDHLYLRKSWTSFSAFQISKWLKSVLQLIAFNTKCKQLKSFFFKIFYKYSYFMYVPLLQVIQNLLKCLRHMFRRNLSLYGRKSLNSRLKGTL